jgi:NAD(P)-dependent dehydrogenase (short-subunit alcohol dehydrogenase family)
MTRNLAVDLGPFNIRVNSIIPGRIEVHTDDELIKMVGITGAQLDAIFAPKTATRNDRASHKK